MGISNVASVRGSFETLRVDDVAGDTPLLADEILGPLDVRAPVHLDERNVRLDEPSGNQAALAKAVRSVGLADTRRLAFDVQRRQASA